MTNIDKVNFHATVAREHESHHPGWPVQASPVANGSSALLRVDHRKLEIAVDPDSGLAVFKVVDTDSGRVVTQIPAASGTTVEAVALMRRGVLIDSK